MLIIKRTTLLPINCYYGILVLAKNEAVLISIPRYTVFSVYCPTLLCVCMYALCMCVCICTCMCICVCICLCLCVYICLHVWCVRVCECLCHINNSIMYLTTPRYNEDDIDLLFQLLRVYNTRQVLSLHFLSRFLENSVIKVDNITI